MGKRKNWKNLSLCSLLLFTVVQLNIIFHNKEKISEEIRDLTANGIGQKLGTLGRYMGHWADIGQTLGRHWADIG